MAEPKKRVRLAKNGALMDNTELEAKRMLKELESVWHESADNAPVESSGPGLAGVTKLGNTSRARQLRSAYKCYVSDLGGADICSYAELELARRAAALSVMAAELESQFTRNSEDFRLDDYVILTKAQMQVLKTMGLKRRQKKVDEGPKKLDEYLAAQVEYSRVDDEVEPSVEDRDFSPDSFINED